MRFELALEPKGLQGAHSQRAVPLGGLNWESCGNPRHAGVPALHGAFLSECIQPRSSDQSPRGEPYAQGYPCPGEPGRGRPKGARDRRLARMNTAADLVGRSMSERLTPYA